MPLILRVDELTGMWNSNNSLSQDYHYRDVEGTSPPSKELVLANVRRVPAFNIDKHIKVFEGTLTGYGNEPLTVLCKISCDESMEGKKTLAKERWAYNRLHDLQGLSVPHFYGHYVHDDSDTECIVFEYIGEPVTDFRDMDRAFRIRILDTFRAIHDRGVEVDHFYPSNVRINQGHHQLFRRQLFWRAGLCVVHRGNDTQHLETRFVH
ncbi:hypothetical protein BV25DRAFT_1428665 [Artomyces pyxidatus]|uniref:Uncharacterized protein n=1 Tax=Artomyces pyxidatus TaxID=48021 RepID=A0ACB8SMD8_9AGAM|nr:hypothetical protein BV25DRAFT_1428665 [Artomyces pyxidatus]